MPSAASIEPAPSRPNSPTISPSRSVRSRPSTRSRFSTARSKTRKPRNRKRRSRRSRRPCSASTAGDVADHLVHHRLPADLAGAVIAADAAVAHHDDAVGDGKDLGEPVRHEDDRHALLAKGAHPVEEPLRFRLRQRRGRLVEDQDARILRQRPRDDDELLRREIERRHRRGRDRDRARNLAAPLWRSQGGAPDR